MGIRTKTGSNQLAEFNALVEAHSEAAYNRQSVVRERIAELEAELADSRQLLRKLEAAAGTS